MYPAYFEHYSWFYVVSSSNVNPVASIVKDVASIDSAATVETGFVSEVTGTDEDAPFFARAAARSFLRISSTCHQGGRTGASSAWQPASSRADNGEGARGLPSRRRPTQDLRSGNSGKP